MPRCILAVVSLLISTSSLAQEYEAFVYDGPSCDVQKARITEALDQAWEDGVDPDITFLFARHLEQCLKIPPPEPVILEHFTPEYYAHILGVLIADFQNSRPDEYFTDHYRGKRNTATCRRIIIEEVRALKITDVATIEAAKDVCVDTMGDIWYDQLAHDRANKGEDVDDEISAAINEVFGREMLLENVRRVGRVIGTVGITAGAIVITDRLAHSEDD